MINLEVEQQAPNLTFEALPVELVEVIFEHFVTLGAPTRLAGSSPTRLCLVCRHWRDVAIKCPKLWCAIRLTCTQLQKLGYMNVWLQRSKQLPISVGLWTKGYYEYDKAVARVLRTFWKSGRTDGEITYMVNEMEIDLRQGHSVDIHPNHTVEYPFLRKLNITQGEYSSPQPFLELMPSRSPNLEKLVWHGPNFQNVLAPLILSSSISTTLSDIDLETSLSSEYCFPIFSTFPLLRRFILRSIRDGTDPAPPFRKHFTMLHLQELILIGDINPLNIIQRLTTPRLTSLTLAATNPRQSFTSTTNAVNLPLFSEFLLRSAAPLRELTIEDIPLAQLEYTTILKNLDDLETLSVYDGFSLSSQSDWDTKTHVVLQTLFPPKDPALSDLYTCPNLRALILRGRIVAPDGFLSQLVEDRFYRSKRGQGVALENIQLESYRNIHSKDDERLQVLSSKMMDCGKNLKVKVCGVMLGHTV